MTPTSDQATLLPHLAHEIDADTLYSLALGEAIWPQEKRKIYCSVTGKPWGKVSEEHVREIVSLCGNDIPKLELMISRMVLFSGPSPLWQSKIAATLVENKLRDPAGFLVYLISHIVLKRVYEKQRTGDLDYEIKWRQGMTALFSAYSVMDRGFLGNVNDALLNISAEGYIAQPHQLPAQNILDYSTKEMLTKLVDICRKQYKYLKIDGEYYGLQRTTAQRPKHFVHGRAANSALGLEEFDTQTARKLRDLQLLEIVRGMDLKFTPHEKALAKHAIGVDSPMLQIFRDLERNKPELVKEPGTGEKAKFVVSAGAPIQFSFGKKSS